MAAEAHGGDGRTQATSENWMYPPEDGWTYDQVKELDVPFDWELVDGNIAVRGASKWWHGQVRDELYLHLESARRAPYATNVERWTMFDERTVSKPDVVVFDKTGLDIRTLEWTPVASVVLAIEVVSPGSRTDDRFRKPGMYAEAGIAYYWRVERGEDDIPVVHEFWRHHESGVFVPSPDSPVHTGKLTTEVPFPVDIDLGSLVEV
ncbi:Uma2 family endonuclease [Streptomyces sp. NBC_01381]|uniref:Uma2 family endonuclease n=1 Tax=Streptomyces sp. NBC_01381 TaxID=2903845 RepID=UPI002253B262|nr:Uma2 family endonuclease [Streptomyces sp. NBC_01381]MCX4666343.1 Uma2 family endonuclease [Streptomyces sp. NBC_01381]